MQGPFSQALNEALIDEFDIKCMVTKASGSAGGFMEKVAAAQSRGIDLIVIDRPVTEEGLSLEEVKEELVRTYGA